MDKLIGSVGFGLVTASVLAIGAVAFTLQFGVTNILNLAFGDVMTLGAFAGYEVTSVGASVWLALVVGAAVGAVVSLLLNRLVYAAFVRKGTPLFGMVIVTTAAALIIQNTLLGVAGPHYYTYNFSAGSTLRAGGLILTVTQLEIIALAVVTMAAVHLGLTRTRLGKAMRATASDPALARSCGIHTARVIDVVWAMSGLLCGMAGVALVMNTVTFEATTGGSFAVVIIAAAVLGGVGEPYGAMLGALVIGIVSEVAAAYLDPSLKNVFAFAVLVLVLLVRPQGLLARIRGSEAVVA